MKYVFVTKENSNGVSEVFHSIVVPEDLVAQDFVERWTKLVDNSPIQAMTVTGKANVAVGSSWNEDTEEFTLADGVDERSAKSLNSTTYVFVVDGIVIATLSAILPGNIPNSMLTAAFADPVKVFSLSDDSPVSNGYTYDGTDFFAPEDI